MPRATLGGTYRVQLHADFTFRQAADIVAYLAELGVSHLYASPYLQAAPGSTHGYDVIDHTTVNRELGGESGRALLQATLERHELGQVLDVVPNHMAVVAGNAPWWDVLTHGRESRFAGHFDIDWEPPEPRQHERVLLPVLGDHLANVLENEEIAVVDEGGDLVITYHEHRFPVAPGSLLAAGIERDGAPERLSSDRLTLAVLLELQHYRLAFWRTAARELNYRRFFDIETLAGLRVEDPDVFDDVHALVLEWLSSGALDGIRIDHPDGLRDPQAYFDRLRVSAPDAWVVAEKILEPGEHLPESWPVAGTTGYEFAALATSLLVDGRNERALSATYTSFTGEPSDWHDVVSSGKHLALASLFGGELDRLAMLGVEICEQLQRDHPRSELRDAITEALACFPVYRTYVRPHTGEIFDQDREHVRNAIAAAQFRRPDLTDALALIADVLLLNSVGAAPSEFVLRFQQLSGPAMAKGVEDTAFYRYNRLAALNEVGGDPGRFGAAPRDFHEHNRHVHERWPFTMVSSSTHDTKRSEDVRARIALLSEIPDRWNETVHRWAALNERHRVGYAPDRNLEYLLYQVFVGAWPLSLERAATYAHKAAREAKQRTSWLTPDEDFERGVRAFLEAVFASEDFTNDLARFVTPLVEPGRVNALTQALLKFTSPGIPDVYQGNEVWDLSLVDPDNRRPVDYGTRAEALRRLDRIAVEDMLAASDEGLPKLWLTRQALHLRRRRPAAFGAEGTYEPLRATGPKADHVVAFVRGAEVITVVPRLVIGLDGDWDATTLELPAGHWRDELTGDDTPGGEVEVADLLRRFPVALLGRERVG